LPDAGAEVNADDIAADGAGRSSRDGVGRASGTEPTGCERKLMSGEEELDAERSREGEQMGVSA